MNIGNNQEQLNISNRLGVYKTQNSAPSGLQLPKDSFQKAIYVPASKKLVSPSSGTSVNSTYSPNQLLRAYSDPSYVRFLISTNPNIKNILDSHGVECKIYPENISKISKAHINSTTAYARQIANQMNISPADKKILEQACVFHDFGKILIPKEILLKPCSLSDSEKEIMNLHSELGAELLSSTGMNNRVLGLIKNHHHNNNENADILSQILSVADIYSALREERSYKTSMSEKDALSLLDQKAKNGEVSTEVVNALKSSLTMKSAYSA